MTPASDILLPWSDNFSTPARVMELHPESMSNHPHWWVNSGGYMDIKDGRGQTIHGSLTPDNVQYKRYADNSETDFGKHPQSIFRLYSRRKVQNVAASAMFRLDRYIMSDDIHRAASNGVLVYLRATGDGQTMYYGGMRVDGYCVIKKKYKGVYTTLATKWIIDPQGPKYHRTREPNKLPIGKWIGIKFAAVNEGGRVRLNLWWDLGWTGTWTPLLSEPDMDIPGSSPALTEPGLWGLRTDFADVTFDNARLVSATV